MWAIPCDQLGRKTLCNWVEPVNIHWPLCIPQIFPLTLFELPQCYLIQLGRSSVLGSHGNEQHIEGPLFRESYIDHTTNIFAVCNSENMAKKQ
jgi:hypothetical protein